MTRKLSVLLAILTVVCWAEAAGATTTYFLNLENSGAAFPNNPAPFGEVNVSLVNSTTAHIEFTTLAPSPLSADHDSANAIPSYTFINKIGANVNATVTYGGNNKITSTGFSVSDLRGFTETDAPAAGSFTWNPQPSNGGQTFDSFGLFNLVIAVPNAGHSDADRITFTLTKTIGVWASEAAVLALNAEGFHIAAHEVADFGPSSNTFIVTDGKVPVPSTVLLLGSGLLGLVCLSWRRNRKS